MQRSGVRPSVHPSVHLSGRHTRRDSPEGSMRRGQRTFQPDNKEDRHTCSTAVDNIVTEKEHRESLGDS